MGQILGWAGAHPLDPPMGAHVSLPGRKFALGCRLRFCETAPTPYADIKTHVWLHKKSFPCYLVKFCMVYNHMNLHDAQLARGHASYNFVFVPIDFFIKLYCLANNWCLS